MSQLPPSRIFRGFWIDHQRGIVLGSTITTSSRTATFVVAILSLLIAFSGKFLWKIFSDIFFRLLTADEGENAFHTEQLALVRESSFQALVTKVYHSWQHRRQQAQKRTFGRKLDLLLLVVSFLCSVGFVVAGVLSSQVVTTGNINVLALASSSSCAFTNIDFSDILATQYSNRVVQESVDYTHRCYNGSRSDPGCQIYTTQAIPFSTSYESCPFGDEMCTLAKMQALKMDTGLLWSTDIFGINTDRRNALAIRQVTTCAPLNTSRYQNISPMDDLHSQELYSRGPLAEEYMVNLNLGGWIGSSINDTSTATSVELNTSLSYGLAVAYWSKESTNLFQASPWSVGEGIDPIEPLQNIGDLTLLMLTSNTLQYSDPVDDPFYSAHQPQTFQLIDNGIIQNQTLYRADNHFSVIGCAQQYQFCTREDKCTDLTYATSATSQIAAMDLTPFQNVTLYSFANAIINYAAGFDFLFKASALPLLARDGALRGQTHSIPPNQWELEVKYWTAIILTAVQRYMADFVAAAEDSSYDYTQQNYRLPSGPSEKTLCHAQKVKAPSGVSNISVFWLSFIIGVCGMIILLRFTLVRMISWTSRSLGLQCKIAGQVDMEKTQEFVWQNDFHALPNDKASPKLPSISEVQPSEQPRRFPFFRR